MNTSRHPRPHFQGKRTATQPANRTTGLSSETNRAWVMEILDRSTQDEIANVLKLVRYQPPPGSISVSLEQIGHAVDKHATAYLGTANGQTELARRQRELISQQAEKWLDSEEAHLQLEKLKASSCAGKLAADPDLFEQACRQEITKQVEDWLRSPVGQEAIEQER